MKPPDRDAEDLKKSGGVWEATKAVPGPTKDSASVELVGTAEGAITAEPEALEPRVGSEDGCGRERDMTAGRVAQVTMPVGEQVLGAPPPHRDMVVHMHLPDTLEYSCRCDTVL